MNSIISNSEWTVLTSSESAPETCLPSQHNFQYITPFTCFSISIPQPQYLHYYHMSEPPQSPVSARRQSRDDNSSCTLVSNSAHTSCSAHPMAYNESVDDFRDTEYPMMKGRWSMGFCMDRNWWMMSNRKDIFRPCRLNHICEVLDRRVLKKDDIELVWKPTFNIRSFTAVRSHGGFDPRKDIGLLQSRPGALWYRLHSKRNSSHQVGRRVLPRFGICKPNVVDILVWISQGRPHERGWNPRDDKRQSSLLHQRWRRWEMAE